MKIRKKKESQFGLDFIATGDDTGGEYFQSYTVIPAGDSGPPVHYHLHENEGFYILSGDLTMIVVGTTHQMTEGDYLSIEKGDTHTWRNDGDTDTKVIITFSPAGIENMFRELANPSMEFTEVAHRYGMCIVEQGY